VTNPDVKTFFILRISSKSRLIAGSTSPLIKRTLMTNQWYWKVREEASNAIKTTSNFSNKGWLKMNFYPTIVNLEPEKILKLSGLWIFLDCVLVKICLFSFFQNFQHSFLLKGDRAFKREKIPSIFIFL
jgi:hypothetical protein